MAAADLAKLVVLSELMNSDDEKPYRGKHVIVSNVDKKGVVNKILREMMNSFYLMKRAQASINTILYFFFLFFEKIVFRWSSQMKKTTFHQTRDEPVWHICQRPKYWPINLE